MADTVHDSVQGDGYAVADLDALGDGPGFRKVRSALGVEAFGVNAVELPPGHATDRHFHDRQEELYLVLRGTIEFSFGAGGERHVLGPGGLARVDAPTVRSLRNCSDSEPALYFCVGGEGGYVGRDGRRPSD
jgi:uncharacterized cupin superfamily protein